MAKAAAKTIAAEVSGSSQPRPDELGVVCLMDMATLPP
jgi:hypothetical protein